MEMQAWSEGVTTAWMKMVDHESYSYQTARGWGGWPWPGCAQPVGQAERAAAAVLDGAWGVNAGNLCPKTMPFVLIRSVRPSTVPTQNRSREVLKDFQIKFFLKKVLTFIYL
jgi:hypothetical protein